MKNKFLNNYTSNVPVRETIYRIEQVLIRCGVSGITKEYGPGGLITAIGFHIETPNGKVEIRLPADKDRWMRCGSTMRTVRR